MTVSYSPSIKLHRAKRACAILVALANSDKHMTRKELGSPSEMTLYNLEAHSLVAHSTQKRRAGVPPESCFYLTEEGNKAAKLAKKILEESTALASHRKDNVKLNKRLVEILDALSEPGAKRTRQDLKAHNITLAKLVDSGILHQEKFLSNPGYYLLYSLTDLGRTKLQEAREAAPRKNVGEADAVVALLKLGKRLNRQQLGFPHQRTLSRLLDAGRIVVETKNVRAEDLYSLPNQD